MKGFPHRETTPGLNRESVTTKYGSPGKMASTEAGSLRRACETEAVCGSLTQPHYLGELPDVQ